jgi:hypothetical protein
MEYLLYAVISLAISYAVSLATAPDPPKMEAGTMDIPSTEEGRTLRVIVGTNIIKDPYLLFYGNVGAKAIRKKGGKK